MILTMRYNIAFNSFLLYYFYYFRHLYNKIFFSFLLYKEIPSIYVVFYRNIYDEITSLF